MKQLLLFFGIIIYNVGLAQTDIPSNSEFELRDSIVFRLRREAKQIIEQDGDKKRLAVLIDSSVSISYKLEGNLIVKNYVTFFKTEKIVLDFYLKNYRTLLNDIRIGTHYHSNHRKRYIQQGLIWQGFEPIYYDLTFDKDVETRIQNTASISQEEKELLKLYWKSINNRDDFNEVEQNQIDSLSNDFLLQFPSSIYSNFIKNYIQNIVKKNKTFGIGVDVGGGIFNLTGNVSNELSNGYHFIEAVDIQINSLIFSLKLQVQGGHINDVLFFKNREWTSSARYTNLLYGLDVGKRIINTKRFSFTPYLGSLLTGITLVEDDDNGEEIRVHGNTSLNLNLGVSSDIKFAYNKRAAENEKGYLYFRIRSGIILNPLEKQVGSSGNLLYINLSFGGNTIFNREKFKTKN